MNHDQITSLRGSEVHIQTRGEASRNGQAELHGVQWWWALEESWGAWGLGRGRVSRGIWCRGKALTLVLPDMLP